MPDTNARLRQQVRPVWGSSVEAAANSETFTNVSATAGSALTIPDGCTGLTIAIRAATDTGNVFLYLLGGLTGLCTTDQAGTVLTDATANFTTLGVTVGDRIRNVTDGSSAVITVVGTTTVTHGALSGGANDDWERLRDTYRIERITEPRIVMPGSLAAAGRKSRYVPLDSSWDSGAKAPFLLSSNGTQDVDVFYHFD